MNGHWDGGRSTPPLSPSPTTLHRDADTTGWNPYADPYATPPAPGQRRSPLLFILIPFGACVGLAGLLLVVGMIGAIVSPAEQEEAAATGREEAEARPATTASTTTASTSTTTTEAATSTSTTTSQPPTTTTTAAPAPPAAPAFDAAGFVAKLKRNLYEAYAADRVVGARLDFDEVVVETNLVRGELIEIGDGYPPLDIGRMGMVICTSAASLAEDLGYDRLVVTASGGEYLAQARENDYGLWCQPWS